MTDINSAPKRLPFVFSDGKADAHMLGTSDLTPSGKQLNLDIFDAVRPAFQSGQGTVCVQAGASDEDLLATIKMALSFGQPFTVLPPTQPNEMHHMISDRSIEVLDESIDCLRKTGMMGPFNKTN